MFHKAMLASAILALSLTLSLIPSLLGPESGTAYAEYSLSERGSASAPRVSLIESGSVKAKKTYVYSIGDDTVTVSMGGDPYLSLFTDINPDEWYAEGIRYVLEHGIMNGMGKAMFAPGGKITRAQLATILWNMEKRPETPYTTSFSDVKSGDWFVGAVSWAVGKEYMNGVGSGKFDPNGELTREQLATILYRYASEKGKGFKGVNQFKLNFPDANQVSQWAVEPFCWMTFNGIMNGKDGKLAPKDGATRAEIATVLMRFNEIISK